MSVKKICTQEPDGTWVEVQQDLKVWFKVGPADNPAEQYYDRITIPFQAVLSWTEEERNQYGIYTKEF